MIRNFVIISILLASPLASASNSLTWQKLALEEKVQRKYNSALSTVLKDNQYLVEVEVDVNDPGGPNFGDDAKSGVRVSDISLSESRGDYIAFSKVGLEVPVVDKFFDEDRTKLMNLYRFNEAYDLFKNITTLNVTVYFSDKVQAPLLEIAKKLLSSSKLSVAGVKPSIKFETIAMEDLGQLNSRNGPSNAVIFLSIISIGRTFLGNHSRNFFGLYDGLIIIFFKITPQAFHGEPQ